MTEQTEEQRRTLQAGRVIIIAGFVCIAANGWILYQAIAEREWARVVATLAVLVAVGVSIDLVRMMIRRRR